MQKQTQADLLEEIYRRLPDAFRFARPGAHVQLLPVKDANDNLTALRLQIGACKPGRTLTLSVKKYGGAASCRRAAHAIAHKCALSLTDGHWSSEGVARVNNKSGAANIQFQWKDGSLTVAAYIGKANSGQGIRSFSVERHGLRGALDKAIKVRRAGGYEVDEALLWEMLQAEYKSPRHLFEKKRPVIDGP